MSTSSPTTSSRPPREGKLESQTQRFVDSLAGAPPLYTLSPEDARGVLEKAQSIEVPKKPAEIEDKVLPVGPSGEVSVRIARPQGADGKLPAIVYVHGGGWVLGSSSTHDRLIREFANGARAAVVFVNYTPSPEAHYPVALEEAYAAAKYIVDHADELRIDPSRLAVAGDSVGGNMATALTMLAKERGGPNFRFQALFYPVTDSSFDTESYKRFAEGPWLTRRSMQWFFDAYAPDVASRSDPTISPLRATLDQLGGLPPALIITDENDVLRDEGEAYAHKLMDAGVRVKAMRALGTIHDFMMLNALADTPAVRAAFEIANEELAAALAPKSAVA
jgi:acetyl esterase